LSASVPPLSEALQLYDYFIAFGPHLNLLCVTAQLMMWRETLLKTEQNSMSVNILDARKWPPLNAKKIIAMAMAMVAQLPPELYDKICRHATDSELCSKIVGRKADYVPLKE